MARNAGFNQTTYPAVLGQVLARKRAAKNLDQEEIAKLVGVSQPTWSRIERGETPINVSMLAQTATVLQISPSSILKEAEKAVDGLNRVGVKVLIHPPREKPETMLLILGGALLSLLIAKKLLK